jgi:hypothetical protein
MPAQPWSTVAQQWQIVTDDGGLYSRIDRSALYTLIGASDESDRDTKATQQLVRMTNHYRQRLLLRFQKSYPNTAEEFLKRMAVHLAEYRGMRGALQNAVGLSDLSTENSNSINSDSWPNVTLIDTGATLYYVTSDDPTNGTSGTYAGTAENGAYLVKEPVEKLYINRGTKASPIWVRWDTTSLIDYILNPEELLECGYLRAIAYLKGYGTIMDNNDFTQRLDFMPKVQQAAMKELIEAEDLAFELLRVDESADGLISDNEVKRQTRKRFFF